MANNFIKGYGNTNISDKVKRCKEFYNKNKKMCTISLIAFIIILILIIILLVNHNKKEIDTTSTIHGITINDNTLFYKEPNEKELISTLEKGKNVYIFDKTTDRNGLTWYYVDYNNQMGYINEKDAKYFVFNDSDENTLMSDVSKFNVIYEQFKTENDYELFLIENNFNYVYIRAGGRGYGQDGNMYIDQNADMYINACEYLGIPYGFYYIDEALNEEEVNEEIEFMQNFISEHAKENCLLPVVIDMEYHDGSGRADTKDALANRSRIAQNLLNGFKNAGLNAFIYSNAQYANKYLSDVDSDFWLSYYTEETSVPNYWYTETNQDKVISNTDFVNKMKIWQFSETGASDIGIDIQIDLNLVKDNFLKKFVIKDK